eukprot:1709601-Rhodomonas_salina.1
MHGLLQPLHVLLLLRLLLLLPPTRIGLCGQPVPACDARCFKAAAGCLSLIHISEPTRPRLI